MPASLVLWGGPPGPQPAPWPAWSHLPESSRPGQGARRGPGGPPHNSHGRGSVLALVFLLTSSLQAADPFEALHESLDRQADASLARILTPPPQPEPPEPPPQPKPSLARILEQEGAPAELLNVARVESGFNPFALSPKGARGLWQFMPDTARRFGLRVDARRDDRLQPELSTRAAARYLRFLHATFGDWKLALAAYNAGEGRVLRAIQQGRTRDFREIARRRLLPEETRRYVPAVLRGLISNTPAH